MSGDGGSLGVRLFLILIVCDVCLGFFSLGMGCILRFNIVANMLLMILVVKIILNSHSKTF